MFIFVIVIKLLLSVVHVSFVSSLPRTNSNPVSIYFGEGSPYMMSREVKFGDLSSLGSSRSSMHRESRCFAVCVKLNSHVREISVLDLFIFSGCYPRFQANCFIPRLSHLKQAQIYLFGLFFCFLFSAGGSFYTLCSRNIIRTLFILYY